METEAHTIKVLVLSDSHTSPEVIAAIVQQELPFDKLVFCGDGFADLSQADLPSSFTINAVIGNVDRPRGFFTPEQLVTEIGGKKFLITHGDLFGVKHGLEKLRHHGEILDVDVILFGHTHEQYADTQSVPMLINPGTAKYGQYCVIKIGLDTVRPVLKSIA